MTKREEFENHTGKALHYALLDALKGDGATCDELWHLAEPEHADVRKEMLEKLRSRISRKSA